METKAPYLVDGPVDNRRGAVTWAAKVLASRMERCSFHAETGDCAHPNNPSGRCACAQCPFCAVLYQGE